MKFCIVCDAFDDEVRRAIRTAERRRARSVPVDLVAIEKAKARRDGHRALCSTALPSRSALGAERGAAA